MLDALTETTRKISVSQFSRRLTSIFFLFSQISTAVAVVDGVTKVAQVLEKVQDINRALVKVKEGLHSVKVSEFDATKVQREIEGELFDKWHENCEVWFIYVRT